MLGTGLIISHDHSFTFTVNTHLVGHSSEKSFILNYSISLTILLKLFFCFFVVNILCIRPKPTFGHLHFDAEKKTKK